MRTREKSKAQLLKELKDLNELIKTLKAELRASLAREDAAMKQLKDSKDLHENDAALHAVNEELKKELDEKTTLLHQAHHDREFYKRWKDRLEPELKATQEALRTLAQSTGRIGKADEPNYMSMTDQCR
jgi:hypothetical protein